MPKNAHLYKRTSTGLVPATGVPRNPIIDTELNEYFHKRLRAELSDRDPVYSLFSSVTYRETRSGMAQVCVRVTSKHKATWMIFYRPQPGASENKHKLAEYRDINHDQAVKLAVEARNAVSEGMHPRDAHRQKVASEGPTLAECLEDKIQDRGMRPERPKGLAQATVDTHRKHMRLLRHYSLADKLMSQITSFEVSELYKKIPQDIQKRGAKRGDGYATASKCINLINEMYLFAHKRYETEDIPPQKIITHNPCDPLKATKIVGSDHRVKKASDRSIRQAELARFWSALDSLKDYEPDRHNKNVQSHIVGQAYLKFMLLTGMRGGALSNLKFRMHDEKTKVLYIVGDDKFLMKAKNDFMLPLSNEAEEIIREMKQRHGSFSEFIFPDMSGKKGAAIGVPPWVQKVRERVDIDFTAHGLRSTFITCAESCGVEVNIYKQLVDHGEQPQDVTSGYTRTEIEHMRSETQRVTDFILENAGVKKKKKETIFTGAENLLDIKDELHEEIERLANEKDKGVKEMYEICLKLGSLVYQFPEVKAEKLINMMRLL
ncbi:tyrosine-type recombinase/integrase [Halomonas sp. SCS19]|uniref:tyrosine-type recombinase/integrase n=1 Tax=Halomonas sp. SCS19 TaxID=2950870 RepID=UPI0032DEBCAE